MLKILLLGPPVITLNDEPLTGFVSRKAQALLFFLATTGHLHSRDELTALLWGELPEDRAKNNLRTALTNLRKLLPQYLSVSRQAVGFNQNESYQLDVEQFRSAVEGDLALQETQQVRALVDLYRGEFLEGFYLRAAVEFEQWVLRQREHFHVLAVNGLDRLAKHFVQTEDNPSAFAVTEQLLVLEPWRESAHQQRMVLLARTGQRTAALQQYESCVRVLAEEFGAQPLIETTRLYQEIKEGRFASPTHGALPEPRPTIPYRFDRADSGLRDDGGSNAPPIPATQQTIDLSNVPEVPNFCGRQHELAQLADWIVSKGCRLVTIVGIGGQGKTALAAQLVRMVAEKAEGIPEQRRNDGELPFALIVWRSLLNAPPLEEILLSWVLVLSDQQMTELPPLQDDRFGILSSLLSQRRCLLVLDNVESIMEGGKRAGQYRPGYQDYEQLFQHIGVTKHASCLLITSRERPNEIQRSARNNPLIRSLQLSGLPINDARGMLEKQQIFGEPQIFEELSGHYSGNPLALKLVATTIHDLYFGDTQAFLNEDVLIFDDIREVLDRQYLRLSKLEQDIMLWLAIERESVSVSRLQENLADAPGGRAVLEALRSLQRRSLVETLPPRPNLFHKSPHCGLQNVIMEYMTDRLVDGVCREIEGVELHEVSRVDISLFNSHALIKAQSHEYVRDSQRRLILRPVAERLVSKFGQIGAIQRLHRLLERAHAQANGATGYMGANLLHLLLHLNADLSGSDFSHLAVWQADLCGASLPNVNFAESDLSHSRFTDTLAPVLPIAFSPDGSFLAAATGLGEVCIWRSEDAQLIARWQTSATMSLCIAFSPDSKLLATGGVDSHVCLWDITQLATMQHGQLRHKFEADSCVVNTVSFHPHGEILVCGGNDGAISVWNWKNGRFLYTLSENTNPVLALALSPDGKLLAGGNRDGTVGLWEIGSQGKAVFRRTLTVGDEAVCFVAFNPMSTILASAEANGVIRLWDLRTILRHDVEGRASPGCSRLEGHSCYVWMIAFSPDGNTLASAGTDQTIRLWDVNTARCRQVLQGHTDAIQGVSFSPDGNIMASSGLDHAVRLWSHSEADGSFHCSQTLQGYPATVWTTAFSPDGKLLAIGGIDHIVRLWDFDTGHLHSTLRGHTGIVTSTTFSPDGSVLASGAGDHTIRLWDADSGTLLQMLTGHSNRVVNVTISPNGQILASCSQDHTIKLWRMSAEHNQSDQRNVGADSYPPIVMCQMLATLSGHTNTVSSVAFSPDGLFLASGGYDAMIYIWDVQRREKLHEFTGHADDVYTVLFSPDGRLLVSAAADALCVWDMTTLELCSSPRGHVGTVGPIAFSPDGKRMATGGGDLTIRLWNIDARSQISNYMTIQSFHSGTITSVRFSPDGRALVSSGGGDSVALWDVETGQCLRTLKPEPPYAGMNIRGIKGITPVQKQALLALGAVEKDHLTPTNQKRRFAMA